ncbi:MAG: PrgI family protein [Candidatus Saccharibacteria bacterium]
MATYKVIQDIEAEDHILGPLTLRQFIFGLITVFLLYMSFLVYSKGAAFLLILFVPPALFTGFFALPIGKDQPTEVWALAKLRFLFKPRKRIWDQSGVKELVTITVPKKVAVVRTNGLTQSQVRSRLSALASTTDSRGWAIKNVNVNLYNQLAQPATDDNRSDRLVDATAMPQAVPDYEVLASDDILDEQSNPIAQQFDQMINASSQAHRQQLINTMNDVRTETAAATPVAPENYWFLNQAPTPPADGQAVFAAAQVVQPGATDVAAAPVATDDEVAILNRLKAHGNKPPQSYFNAHMKTVQPIAAQAATPTPVTPAIPVTQIEPPKPMTPTPDPAIMNLARNNDLNVSTLAREAYKVKNPEPPQDEVVISLR